MIAISKNVSTGYNISNRGSNKPQWIVIHYFGALGSAKATCQYFIGGDRQSSADFFVDDTSIWQFNPDINKYYTWHCGGGLQGYIHHEYHGICKNANSIGIEMRPYNDRGQVNAAQNAGWYFHDATVKNTADLVKKLMKEYNIDIDHVIMHANVTGKYCPAPFLDRPSEWDAFKKMLKEDTVVSKPVTSTTPSAPSTNTNEIYRIRKTWADSKTQKGAYKNFEAAKKECDKFVGYKVFDSKGNVVYSNDSFLIRVSVGSLQVRSGAGKEYPTVKINGGNYIPKSVYTIVKTEKNLKDGYTWGLLKSKVGWIALDYVEKV